MNQTSSAPTQKLVAAAIAGAVTVIAVWAAKQFAKVDIPGEVASAFTTIVSLVVGYISPPAARDTIE